MCCYLMFTLLSPSLSPFLLLGTFILSLSMITPLLSRHLPISVLYLSPFLSLAFPSHCHF